jgi:hypothetical protein
MQGGKNWIFPKEMNADRFFWDSHWLDIWSNHFCPSVGPNGGSVAMDSGAGVGAGPRDSNWAPAYCLAKLLLHVLIVFDIITPLIDYLG